ncbi:MAG TPA: glutaredoxin domain-containing protein, partial [Terriglobales bacterium]|nr:glutaredoxin domain-containing protein [Terriglobales bacterium]
PPCHVATAYLSERGITYQERDIYSDPTAIQDLVYKYGSRSTPTIVVGEEIMIGFDPDRLNQLLGS